jgi:uncharacterized CHY-type Zn-finger protein
MIKTKRIKNKSKHPIAVNIHSKRLTIAEYINIGLPQNKFCGSPINRIIKTHSTKLELCVTIE